MDNLDKLVIGALQFQWIRHAGPTLRGCSILHPNSMCITQLLVKGRQVVKLSNKFYILFHLIPFLLKAKKYERENKLTKFIFKTLKQYIGSIIFMMHLVGGLKALLCFVNNTFYRCGLQIDGRIFAYGSFISSLSIFWETQNRREQITYFVFVRALRSLYLLLKKRKIFYIGNQKKVCFIMIMGLLSYIFYQNPKRIKHSNIISGLWGTS